MIKIIKVSEFNSLIKYKNKFEQLLSDSIYEKKILKEQVKNMKWHIEFLEQKIREQVEENNEVRAENITLIEKKSALKSRIKTLEEVNAELCSKNDDLEIKTKQIKKVLKEYSS